jgi:hypothetical protein
MGKLVSSPAPVENLCDKEDPATDRSLPFSISSLPSTLCHGLIAISRYASSGAVADSYLIILINFSVLDHSYLIAPPPITGG